MNGKCQHENCWLHNQSGISQGGDICTICGIAWKTEEYAELNERYRSGKKIKVDRSWSEYPVGTISPAIMGGFWHRVERGWKWCTGDTFPGPGADNTGMVILPADPNAAYNSKVRQIAEMIARDTLQDRWEMMSAESNEYRIERKMPIARAMVAEMAKQFAEGFNSLYDFTDDPEFGPLIIQQQIERGLIPNTKTDNNA